MKRIFCLLVAIILFLSSAAGAAAIAPPPDTKAESYLLMDLNSGIIIVERNMHEKRFPASTTKIMTAILAIEKGNLNEMVTCSAAAVNSIPLSSSNMGLLAGETIRFEDLLYGLLVSSASDAANVIAEHLYGNIPDFVAAMNLRAKELGALNTNFVNTHGLHDDNHYTTAYDLAVIAKYALTLPLFKKMAGTASYRIEPTNKYKEVRYLSTTNNLLSNFRDPRFFYQYANGVKTGYTSQAKSCLVGSATYNKATLLSVILGGDGEFGRNQSFYDTANLFRYGFLNFTTRSVVKPDQIISESPVKWAAGNQRLILSSESTLDCMLPDDYNKENIKNEVKLNEHLVAPIKKGEIVGTATFTYENWTLGTINLVAHQDVDLDMVSFIVGSVWEFVSVPQVGIPIACVLLTLLLIWIIRNNANKRKRRLARERKKKYY